VRAVLFPSFYPPPFFPPLDFLPYWPKVEGVDNSTFLLTTFFPLSAEITEARTSIFVFFFPPPFGQKEGSHYHRFPSFPFFFFSGNASPRQQGSDDLSHFNLFDWFFFFLF